MSTPAAAPLEVEEIQLEEIQPGEIEPGVPAVYDGFVSEAQCEGHGQSLVPVPTSAQLLARENKVSVKDLKAAVLDLAKRGREAMLRGGQDAPMVSDPNLAWQALLVINGSELLSSMYYSDPSKTVYVDKPMIDKATGAPRSSKGVTWATMKPRNSKPLHFAGERLGNSQMQLTTPLAFVEFASLGPEANYHRMGTKHGPEKIDELRYSITVSNRPLPGMTTPTNPYMDLHIDDILNIMRYAAHTRMMQGAYDDWLGPMSLDPVHKPEDVEPALFVVLGKFKKVVDTSDDGFRMLSFSTPHSVPVKKTKEGALDLRDAKYVPPNSDNKVAFDLWNRPVRGNIDQRRRMVRVPILCAKPAAIPVTHQITTSDSKKRKADDAELGEGEQAEKKSKDSAEGEATVTQKPKDRLGYPFITVPGAVPKRGDVVIVGYGYDYVERHIGQNASMMPRRLYMVIIVGQRGAYDHSNIKPVNLLTAVPNAEHFSHNTSAEPSAEFDPYALQDDYCA